MAWPSAPRTPRFGLAAPRLEGASRGRYVTLLALLLVVLLVASNLTCFLLYRSVRRELDRELGDRLVSIASTAAEAIGAEHLDRLEATRGALERIATANDLDNIVVVDPSARTLLDLRGETVRGLVHPLAELDPALEATLLSGLAQSTELVAVEGLPGQYLKTGYAAFESDSGRVMGAIVVEGGSTFFRALSTLERRLVWSAALGTAAVVVLGALFFRTLFSYVRLEDSLRRSAALLAIGQISALVAHEIKNPLAIIRSRAERVRAKIEAGKEPAEILEWFEAIPNEVDRLNQIVSNYLSLSSPDQLGQGECDVQAVVSDTEALLSPELSRRAISFVNQVGDSAKVPMGARSLKQILLNLVLNAAEALGEKGTVRVSLETHAKDVELAVEDDGPGMSDEVRRRALEPFFTTKPTGSGLGLTLVASLLAARGGRLEIQAAHPRGTRMKVLLPRTRAEGREQGT